MTTFKQNYIVASWTSMSGATAFVLAIESFYDGHKYPHAAPRFLGASIGVMCLALIFALWALRSLRQSVILDGEVLKVRCVSHTRSVKVADIEGFELCTNVLRNCWLIGAKLKSGHVVKLPFWSASFIRDDTKNERLLKFMSKIEIAVSAAQSGAPPNSGLVTY